MMMAMFNMSSMYYAQGRISDKQAYDDMNAIQEPDEKMNIIQDMPHNMSELQPFPVAPMNMNKNEHGEWIKRMLPLDARKYAAFIWFRELMMLMISFNEDKYYKQKLSQQLSAYDERTAWDEWMTGSVMIPSELFDVKNPICSHWFHANSIG